MRAEMKPCLLPASPFCLLLRRTSKPEHEDALVGRACPEDQTVGGVSICKIRIAKLSLLCFLPFVSEMKKLEVI